MIGYLARRLLMALVTVYVVVTASFYVVRLMPGNAIQFLEFQLQQQGGVSPDQIKQQVQAILRCDAVRATVATVRAVHCADLPG